MNDILTLALTTGIASAIVGAISAFIVTRMNVRRDYILAEQTNMLSKRNEDNRVSDAIRDDLIAQLSARDKRERELEKKVSERDATIDALSIRVRELTIQNTQQAIEIINLTSKLEQYEIRLKLLEEKLNRG